MEPRPRVGPSEDGAAAGEAPRVELIGTHLRAEGSVDLGRFSRVSDYVNILSGFFNIRDVVLLSRTGEPTRIVFPEFRVRLDEIAIVGQHTAEADPAGAGPWGDAARVAPPPDTDIFEAARAALFEGHGAPIAPDTLTDAVSSTVFTAPLERADPGLRQGVETGQRHLVISTAAHLVYGFAHLHEEASMMAFLDATDPHFIPMTNVRVRWLADRRLAGHFPFALIQRIHIVGVASDEPGGG